MSPLTLDITRTLGARPLTVFEAFTTPDQLSAWWGPRGFGVPSLEFSAEIGESYRIEMQPPDGDPFYLAGEFRDVREPERLAFTFAWEQPDPDDAETLVQLSFRDAGEATEAVLTQGPFKTESRLALHRDGWTDTFDKLEAFLAERP